MGITQSTYNSWLDSKKLKRKSVTGITRAEVKSIYYKNYWTCSGANKYNNEYGYHLFDIAVMSSCTRARNFDRQVGGNLAQLIERRKSFFYTIAAVRPKNKRFLSGWLRRVELANASLDKLG
jgi:hypothetical protein